MISGKHTATRLILCVDDDEAVLHYEKALLERSGYAVLAASSAQQGLRLLTTCECDAVLLDYNLTGTNGYEVAHEIKRTLPQQIIVMVSGSDVPLHALALVDAFVPKLEVSRQLLPVIAELCCRSYGERVQQRTNINAEAVALLKSESGYFAPAKIQARSGEGSQQENSRMETNEQDSLQRDRAEKALVASEARYRRLFETAQDGILILDAHSGLIVDVNPFLLSLLDYSTEEFIGKSLWELGPFKNIEASKAAFTELQVKGYLRYENLPLEARNGRLINVEFVSNVYGVNGSSVIQCNIRDISSRRHAEELEERLRQSQKMETLGQLAGGVAHDFNNLLGVILGYCQLLEKHLSPDDSALKMVGQIHDAGNRAAVLTRQLLIFSRRQVLRPLVLDLNRLVAGMETMLPRLIGEHIEVVTSLLPDLGHVKADPAQIEQVLLNLAVNARDAMPHGGTITIETTNVEVDATPSRRHGEAKPGSYVMLAVSDTGMGMDSETQARIFEPFFTTKAPGKGTGLGLSTVYGIVKQSGGYLYASSALGEGTILRIYLPRVEETLDSLSREKTLSSYAGEETILLVEDNAPLRQVMREMLEASGYTVLESGRPAEAIRCAELHEGRIALLISDVVMPKMNGRVLAETLKLGRPQMKVLFTSGYNADIDASAFETQWPLLDKPFTEEALTRKIRDILDSPAP